MKRDFTNDELESFLKWNSDRLRMSPSDKVWENISGGLAKRRRKYSWLTGTFLLATSIISYFLLQPAQPLLTPVASNAQKKDVNELPGEVKATLPQAALTPAPANGRPIASSGFLSRQATRKNSPLRVAYKKGSMAPSQAVLPGAEVAENPDTSASLEATDILSTDAPATTDAPVPSEPLATQPSLPLADASTLQVSNRKLPKTAIEFFVTPTISYRTLRENKSYMAVVPQSNASTNYAALYNINDAVTHKPNIGLELGMVVKRALNGNIRLQGGLQFNMSRYDIKAFSNPHFELATIALRTGAETHRVTSLTNLKGSSSNWLQNLYFQVSLPVGVEVQFGSNDKTRFGVAGTVQPAYMLGDRAYLLSSDYKNYAKVPWLVRRWNVNTALESFVAYSTNKINWKVGPQVRYQMLSSFVSKYPVKEHLFDFGLKVGVTLNRN